MEHAGEGSLRNTLVRKFNNLIKIKTLSTGYGVGVN